MHAAKLPLLLPPNPSVSPAAPFLGVEKHKQLLCVEPAPLLAQRPALGEVPTLQQLTRLRKSGAKLTRMERYFYRQLEDLMRRTEHPDPRDLAKLLSYAQAEQLHGELGDYAKNRANEWAVAGANLAMAAGIALDLGSRVGSMEQALVALGTMGVSWILADLGSGFPFHWSVDVLGSPRTPLVGKMIAEFQKHHVEPAAIAEGDFASVTYSTGQGVALALGIFSAALLAGFDPTLVTESAVLSFAVGVLNAQSFHRWSHTPAEQTPKWIRWMQEHHLAVSRSEHAQHHRVPHEGNYTLVNGIWNKLIDDSKIARWAEKIAHQLNPDIRPTTWIAGKGAEAVREQAMSTTLRDVVKNAARSLAGQRS